MRSLIQFVKAIGPDMPDPQPDDPPVRARAEDGYAVRHRG